MKIQDFNDRLKDSILIADGAMGSMLHEAVGSVRCFDELNATEPEAVFRVHQAYIEAGAQIIESAQEIFQRADMIVKVKEPLPPEWPRWPDGAWPSAGSAACSKSRGARDRSRSA